MINFDRGQQPVPEKPAKKLSSSDFLDVSTIVIVGALVAAIICTFLVQFIFSPEINWRDVGVDTAIISICTMSIYILLRSFTIRRGRRTDIWKGAESRIRTNGAKITNENLAARAADYCRAWEQERLDEAQTALLSRVGVSLEDYRATYCKYSRKELKALPDGVAPLTETQRKAVMKAGRVRRAHYDERYLFDDESGIGKQRSPSEHIKARMVNTFVNLRTVVTTILTCGLSASFLQEVIFDFSAEAVIRCVIKLALVAFFGAIGMIGGYNHATIREVHEMTARADEQERFMKWCERGEGFSNKK